MGGGGGFTDVVPGARGCLNLALLHMVLKWVGVFTKFLKTFFGEILGSHPCVAWVPTSLVY